MKTFLFHIFTSADNETFSMSKVIAFVAVATLAYNSILNGIADVQGYGIAVAAIIGALAAKTFTDVK